ncbi:MAG: hypothetical protein ACFE0S_05605 [Rhodospirillales bacterium]
MPRITAILTIAVMTALPVAAVADAPKQSVPERTEPVDRGYGQHDACFGGKYEREEDLKTGNEDEVMKILKQMLGPGT